ncbi:MAG: TRAP transporter small permease [Desulfobacterales bacterium]|nr:TRAP transporter small permease [Desulfobacterales bacterium]
MKALGKLLMISRKFLVLLGKIEMALAVGLLFLIVACIGTQVFTRYVFNYPIIWIEEISVYSFIWGVFIGAAAGLKYNRHISIQWVTPKASMFTKNCLAAIGHLVTLILVIIILPAALTVMGVEGRSMTTALPIMLPRSLFYSVPFFVGMASMGLTAIHMFLEHLLAMFTGQQVEPILAYFSHDEDLREAEKVLEGVAS